jgi:glycosyltransferase involved in cell wall biosynthesis
LKIERKILRVSTYPTDKFPGAGLHPYYISKLDSSKVFYITPRLEGQPYSTPDTCEVIFVSQWMKPSPKNCSKLEKMPHLLLRLGSITWMSLISIFMVLVKNIRVVHIHSPMYLPVAIFNNLIGGESYITFHGTDFYRVRKAKWFLPFSKIFKSAFCVSPLMVNDLQNIFGEDKVKFVPNGIDEKLIEDCPKERDERQNIIAVGSLKNEKGFKFLVDAYSMLLREREGLNQALPKLLIAGEGYLRRDLEAQIAKLGLEEHVSLLGHQSLNSIKKYYLKSDIFVMSSISEGFPKVVLEAFGFGCRVVTTDVGACSIVVGEDYPYLVPHSDSQALYLALKKMLEDQTYDFWALRESVLNKYSWKNVINQYSSKWRSDV